MSFDKFAQLEAAIDAYGQRMARDGGGNPHTRIAHLMCMERMRAAGEALPRTHVNTDPYQPALEPTYYRNDGLKHIPSRGMPT